MDELRKEVGDAVRMEEDLLTKRSTVAVALQAQTRTLTIVGGVFIMILSGLSFFVTNFLGKKISAAEKSLGESVGHITKMSDDLANRSEVAASATAQQAAASRSHPRNRGVNGRNDFDDHPDLRIRQ